MRPSRPEPAFEPAEGETWLSRRLRTTFHLVALNTGVQLVGRAAAALFALVQVGILSHYLHSGGYGKYAFVLAVIGFFGLLTDMGVSNVSVRAFNQADPQARLRALRGLLAARAILATIALSASLVFAAAAPVDATERQGIVLMSLLYILTIPGAVGGLFQAKLEMQFSTAVGVAQAALGLALTAALVELHATILALLGVQLAVGALGSCALYALSVHRYGVSLLPSIRSGARMVLEALPIGVTAAINVVYLRIDAILLGVMRGATDVAHYSAATRFIDLATFGSAALMASVFPLMVRAEAEADRARLLRAYQTCANVMAFVSIPLAVAWCLLAQPMIFLIYPGDFRPSIVCLQILSWVLVPLFFNSVLGTLVITLHRERSFLWVSLGAAALNIGLNLLFIPLYGVAAASFITVISEIFVTVVALQIMWRVLHYLPSIRSWVPIVASSAAMAIPIYLLRDISWPASVAVGGVVFILSSRALGLWTAGSLRAFVAGSSG